MAGMRVHELAKEFGMSSKELLARLEEMKIPAKNHASTLVDAYVDKIRKALGPELAERASVIEAAAAEKAAKKAAAEEAARAQEEAKRKAAEEAENARREQERKAKEAEEKNAEKTIDIKTPSIHLTIVETPAKKPETIEAATTQSDKTIETSDAASEKEAKDVRATKADHKAETPAKKKDTRKNAEVANKPVAQATVQQAKRPASAKTDNSKAANSSSNDKKVPAQKQASKKSPAKTSSKFDGLLSQIEAEKERLVEEKKERERIESATEASKKQQKQHKGAKGAASQDNPARRSKDEASKKPKQSFAAVDALDEEDGEDRYAKMAKEAEKLQRNKVLDEARAAVEAAKHEGEGRRKKRKEKRAAEKAAEEEAKIEEAILRGEDIVEEGTVKVPTGSTVAEFSELIGVPSNDVIKRLFLLGTPLTLTQTISDDLVELIADDMGRSVKVTAPEDEESLVFYDEPADLKPRPPVVTVMGHVDHGKTSLLDAIRFTGVVETEAGGITQHIGASVVEIGGRQITFIDTPGHEAFTAMRARGAKVTDVVVLVVAADDGVMPQTIEAIHHAEAADVPIVVAVNKIDKAGADPSRVRQELTTHNIVAEEWGGTNMFVDVSAKKRIGIDDLLETILLQADVLELKANPDALASGFVIEANLDKGRGPVATVLIQRGTLRIGDAIVVGTSHGRVRAMLDPKGNNITEALPADPVEVLGLNSVPAAGDEFQVFEDERDARNLAEDRALRRRLAAQNKTRISLDDLFARMKEGEMTDLNLVVKADVQGSIEALQDALNKMDQSEVRINVIHSAVGGITETDVTLAAASDAIIIGFGVRPQPKAKIAAEHEKVDIRTYRVIYQAIEDINQARVGLLSPDIIEVDTGSAEVRNLFRVPKIGVVAGCYVTDGEIAREDNIRIVRDGTVVHEGSISSLRRFKDDVKTVKNGYECGIGIENFQDVKEGDIIEGYRVDEVAREA